MAAEHALALHFSVVLQLPDCSVAIAWVSAVASLQSTFEQTLSLELNCRFMKQSL
jgi:uncharacterized membrane protein YgaE (UPF0421/DUF939 family)